MPISVPTRQLVQGAVPITNIQPPPEGQMASAYEVVLTPGVNSFYNLFQLSSQGGLLLSQVTTLIVDNSQNAYPLQVTHGALAEVLQVAAAAVAVVPTFSSRAGGYPLSITAIENATPAVNLNINVIFLNYPREAGTFSAVNQSTIIATGQNTVPLIAIAGGFAAGGNLMLTNGNYILDSLDMACEGFNATAAGLCTYQYVLSSGSPSVANIASGQVIFTAAGAGWIQGGQINNAIQRTWPQGLILPRGKNITLTIPSVVNITQINMRMNISGVSTP